MIKTTFLFLLLYVLTGASVNGQSAGKSAEVKTSKRKITVTFQLDLSKEIKNITDLSTIGIRGSVAPLAWDKTYPMTDQDRNNIYEAVISFEVSNPETELEYKYVHSNVTWENTENRKLQLVDTKKLILPSANWNDGPKGSGISKEKQDSIDQKKLFNEIALMDSLLFDAYNTQNLEKLMSFFDEDLEFYHDKGGLTNYEQNREAFKENIGKEFKIRRELVKGSLEVYPVKDYGAMEIGAHQFCHVENGKLDCGTFKFLMIWQKKNGVWKITRVASYDH